MPDLQRQEPVFGGELKPRIAHQQMPPVAAAATDAPNETIGEYLRQNRLRMEKTLTDISRASKISTHHLIAIENDAFEELPGRAYATGFVRSYAACLGLDASALVARLKTELAGLDMDPVFTAPSPPLRGDQTVTASGDAGDANTLAAEAYPRPEWGRIAGAACTALQLQKARAVSSFKELAKKYAGSASFAHFSTPRPATHRFSAPERTAQVFAPPPRNMPLPSSPDHPLLTWVTAALMSAVMMYFGYSIIHSGLRAAPPQVIPVPARLAAEVAFRPEKTAPPAVALPEQPARHAPETAFVPSAKDQPQTVPTPKQPDRNASETAPVPPAIAEPPVVAATAKSAPASHESEADLRGDAVPAPAESATAEQRRLLFHAQLPLGERYGEQNKGSRVTLRVHRATFIAVLGLRNHQYIDRVLRAGDTYRVPNMRGLKLNTRDAGAVEVILDGNTVGFAGKDGVALRGMPLQPQSIVSRFHWTQG